MSRIRFGDWTLAPPWTEPRAHALLVLATHRIARVSAIFQTSITAPPTVFRDVAVWLEQRGVAHITNNGLGSTIEITDAGAAFVAALNRRVGSTR